MGDVSNPRIASNNSLNQLKSNQNIGSYPTTLKSPRYNMNPRITTDPITTESISITVQKSTLGFYLSHLTFRFSKQLHVSTTAVMCLCGNWVNAAKIIL